MWSGIARHYGQGCGQEELDPGQGRGRLQCGQEELDTESECVSERKIRIG
jgi:hypothetical protein